MKKDVKELADLSEVEFNKLKKAGLLKTIYPNAPESYRELKGTRPKPLANPDFTPLIAMAEQYVDSQEDPENKRMKDGKHYIFEEVIKCVYGDNRKVEFGII